MWHTSGVSKTSDPRYGVEVVPCRMSRPCDVVFSCEAFPLVVDVLECLL